MIEIINQSSRKKPNAALRGEQRTTTKLSLTTVNTEPNKNQKCHALGIPLECLVRLLFVHPDIVN